MDNEAAKQIRALETEIAHLRQKLEDEEKEADAFGSLAVRLQTEKLWLLEALDARGVTEAELSAILRGPVPVVDIGLVADKRAAADTHDDRAVLVDLDARRAPRAVSGVEETEQATKEPDGAA